MVQKQDGSKIINFKIPTADLARLDKIVELRGYSNRADAIKTLIRQEAGAI